MRTTLIATAAAAVAATVLVGAAVAVVPSAGATTRISTKTMLGQLTVAAEHPTGYARSAFKLWVDADHDGCNTRNEVLIAEAKTKPQVGASCALTGGRWVSPYDTITVTSASALDIDHLVPLAEAWQSGAYAWSATTRERYANDLGYGPDLIAVTAHANRSKGEKEPSAYLPPTASFRCTYEAWWVAVKWRWHLRVNPAERTWLSSHLQACGWPTVTRPGRPSVGPTAGGTASTSGAAISAVYFDSPGSDTGSNSSLNAEWVLIRNTTGSAKSLTGWTLNDASSHTYRFSTLSLAAGATVKVHSGSGTNAAGQRYWRAGSYIWNNAGDTAYLKNAHGALVDRCHYTAAAHPEAHC